MWAVSFCSFQSLQWGWSLPSITDTFSFAAPSSQVLTSGDWVQALKFTTEELSSPTFPQRKCEVADVTTSMPVRWTDEIILIVPLDRKNIDWRRSITAFNEVVVCVIPRRDLTSAFKLPEQKWINAYAVSRFYRSDGESPAESSGEPLFSINNSGTSRTRGSDRSG